MRVRLIRDARVWHKAGEIVEVSPVDANFLTSVGSAVVWEEQRTSAPAATEEQKPAAKPAAKKTNGAKKKA